MPNVCSFICSHHDSHSVVLSIDCIENVLHLLKVFGNFVVVINVSIIHPVAECPSHGIARLYIIKSHAPAIQ